MSTKDRLIFALDVNDKKDAKKYVQMLQPYVGTFKVGLELFVKYGLDIIKPITYCSSVFLDLKLHDIPNTVECTVRIINTFGVKYLTIFSDLNTISRAVSAASNTGILTVSVLTSSDIKTEDKILLQRNALISKESGAIGCICPGSELKEVRKLVGNNFLLITPGVRLDEKKSHDQKVIITPKKAIIDGADKIVIGRCVSLSKNPISVIKQINQQIEEALEEISSDAKH